MPDTSKVAGALKKAPTDIRVVATVLVAIFALILQLAGAFSGGSSDHSTTAPTTSRPQVSWSGARPAPRLLQRLFVAFTGEDSALDVD